MHNNGVFFRNFQTTQSPARRERRGESDDSDDSAAPKTGFKQNQSLNLEDSKVAKQIQYTLDQHRSIQSSQQARRDIGKFEMEDKQSLRPGQNYSEELTIHQQWMAKRGIAVDGVLLNASMNDGSSLGRTRTAPTENDQRSGRASTVSTALANRRSL